ncbi:GspH/FimT family pseudopilin [Halomonas sp. DP8Y7-1]|uniref:GspH/FimT family pseudopilin n=1 Tax=Halomonas sp. DP8Y7-1 TaxID=2859078 RepID=UPI001C937376|nr:GspH/FimT family pseudopilin [Halomonas sp. DP8Y7-1]MBY6027906.1 GspH/FimT family pseudopilin [Halomonas sp. DP8Y7-1]
MDDDRSAAQRPCLQRPQSGATLLELLLVISIIGMLSAVAVPGYRAMIARQHIASDVARLQDALALTRSTAIVRASQVTLCPSADGVHCGTDWTGKLLIKAGAPSWGGATLRVFPPSLLPRIRFREDHKPVRFLANGRASGHNGTFELCTNDRRHVRLVLSNFGRLRSETHSTTTPCLEG